MLSVNVFGQASKNNSKDKQSIRNGEGVILFTQGKQRASDLFRINADGTNAAKIFEADFAINYIAISPASDKIALSKLAAERVNFAKDIWIINTDGTGKTQLTNFNKRTALIPVWSKNGSKIYFMSNKPAKNEPMKHEFDIFSMNSDGKEIKEHINFKIDVDKVFWSPDQTRIAFISEKSGSPQLYIANADGSKIVQLTSDKSDKIFSVSWSPNGKKILFGRGDSFQGGNFYLINRDGSGLRKITKNRTGYANWSPDGSEIIYEVTPYNKNGIYIMNSDGSNKHSISPDSIYFDVISPFVWSPDGSRVAFGARNNFKKWGYAIFIINTNGNEIKMITANDNNRKKVFGWIK